MTFRAYPPCPVCGRATRIRNDGQLAAHRIDANNPASPYCVTSPPKGTR